MAPTIVPSANKAPKKVVLGIRIRIEAMSSITPELILPKGSIPNV